MDLCQRKPGNISFQTAQAVELLWWSGLREASPRAKQKDRPTLTGDERAGAGGGT